MVFWLIGVCSAAAQNRTIYKCWQGGTASIATRPEKGSRCTPEHFKDPQKMAKAWQDLALKSGTLYEHTQDGQIFYSTRNLPGSTPLFRFTADIKDKEKKPVLKNSELSRSSFVIVPRPNIYKKEFAAAARKHKVDEALLRAVAHAESAYSPTAVPPKGAMVVMQLMPSTALIYGVKDPFMPEQSINAAARHLAHLLHLYKGNQTLAAAAYNAGSDAVRRYKGVPPFTETREYVRRVDALYHAYKKI